MPLHKLIDYAGNQRAIIVTAGKIKHGASSDPGEPVSVDVTYEPKSAGGIGLALPHGLPPGYQVFVSPSQPCWATISKQTPKSFTVTLKPPCGIKLDAGEFSYAIVG